MTASYIFTDIMYKLHTCCIMSNTKKLSFKDYASYSLSSRNSSDTFWIEVDKNLS